MEGKRVLIVGIGNSSVDAADNLVVASANSNIYEINIFS